ncbi:MAG TPA: hypothetical protein PKX48_06180 [Planctomycetota bacterium]|nr:hypothetical protein [Planctomycetota bacterium]OQC19861.1 MAG: hypothetical protein BWX69_02351 [Planctomycetes bacterium ADurb.Bin069]HNR99475.1 hypothetical protein [Planctomycetota bacterium]HNU26336.1 hypothetical protein [Planctomycetota bacterium]HOE30529.1 hypothetical protein [Planctomycetota bacterium]
MRRFMLGAVLSGWASAWAAAAAPGATLTGDAEALALVAKVVKALGGEEGLAKRRLLYMEQQVQMAGLGTVQTAMWIKGEKQRLEQRIGALPGAPLTVIFDGTDLFLLVNGEKRDPGETLAKAFHAERKRLDLWWDCRVKPLQVKSLGTEKIAPGEGVEKRELALLEFTHPDKDTTTIGIDPASFQPVYAAYRGPHPHTGAMIPWTQWLSDFEPMESAGGLVFPRSMEIYQDARRLTTAKLTAVRTLAEIPDSLFAAQAARPID